jgi:hypothetical protein
MALLDQREQRTAERMRQENDARAQRDREFMQRDREFMQSMLTLVTSARPAAASVSSESPDLLRRELNLTLEKELFRIRKDLSAAVGQLAAERDEPDLDDGPQDLSEAGDRIGLALLHELEERAPDLINEAIPQIVSWLQGKGFQPSEQLRARMKSPKGVANPDGRT